MSKPIVAVVGRPNVGKSTLFNKLCGQRLAIVEDTPGITRDRIFANCEWSGHEFMLVDTGGIEPKATEGILAHMREQAEIAIDTADCIIMVVDVRDGLTAADCGETLLGVPCEVYERSAFIRQSSLTVDASTELERRIAALITTGEEGQSFSEASAALKKQLNARKYNKSGRIPALEAEISAQERALEELSQLTRSKRKAEEALASFDAEEASLREQLRAHDLCDAQDARRAAQLDPNNTEYQMHLRRMQNPGQTYRTQTTYAQPGGLLRWCWSMILLNLLCNCCCGGWGFRGFRM